jgi:hypothetical protein
VCSGFPKRSCFDEEIDRDDASKKRHHAPGWQQFLASRASLSLPYLFQTFITGQKSKEIRSLSGIF